MSLPPCISICIHLIGHDCSPGDLKRNSNYINDEYGLPALRRCAVCIVARHGTPCPERTALDTRVPPISVRQQPCPYTWTRLQYALSLKALCNPTRTALFRLMTLHRTS